MHHIFVDLFNKKLEVLINLLSNNTYNINQIKRIVLLKHQDINKIYPFNSLDGLYIDCVFNSLRPIN